MNKELATRNTAEGSNQQGPKVPPRGMPLWRSKQRELSVKQKVELLGRFLRETREIERLKKIWNLSAISSNSFSKKVS